MRYERGLSEVGDDLYAYLQPDGGWGWSNAGLVVDGEAALLVDTLYDLALTERMLSEMRAAVPAAAQFDALVNTHANGDHCYGNALVQGARILASNATASEMAELPPAAMAALVQQAPQMGQLGEFFLRCFGSFDFDGIELALPHDTFDGELTLTVGDREVHLLEVGPAHTRGDTLVHLPADGVLYSGDILFSGAHPIMWAGPAGNWIAALDRILELGVAVVVPGHGPVSGPDEVREQRDYFAYLLARAAECHREGLDAAAAAREIGRERWADWGERERLVVNVAQLYRELDGAEPLNALEAFTAMAASAGER
ncbi:MAG TPA: MBL fold metallo-hydrolase [Solirubrobacteraceae bacterium]|nr:MBL fold metallo-hydrolase [Solirubrobacteraceae bacterium]